MKQSNMTALISAFARAYHAKNNKTTIFNDNMAGSLLTEQEYQAISNSMAQGINFFNPKFSGSGDEALRWIVDNRLSPSPLGRAAFAENALQNAVKFGTKQYLIIAAGYDTFAYRQPDWASSLQIFELDRESTLTDKKARLAKSGIQIPDNVHFVNADLTDDTWPYALTDSCFDKSKITFCSLLGITYYLSAEVFKKLVAALSTLVPEGSTIVFDYPNENTYTEKAGERAKKQTLLARGANEAMLASYSYQQMEKLLSDCGFLIYEHINPAQITDRYFAEYNKANPSHPMTAFDNVNYCLAVKKL